ncbi:uncharacterized protein B0I36DRAFT_29174 [Microdochium trichocladiopsis]|uniref:Zn(2)-C6 fungal-type domain-containing protein n=1 Tax=Microdochium trichocladiopsis TaxID=1682393 RepID=A0A9P8XYZ6_9PEZI|nr:uncharacterized protein B0I36DRAFT_29174 [Microdochium trichocladiopsis]KAH7021114.1 hypothetical protein B0I36DRAFT_29174 [Microdochium trichocladiopsis]
MNNGMDLLNAHDGGVDVDFSKLSTADVDFTLFDDSAMLDADQLLLFEPSIEADDAVPSIPRPYHAKRPHKKSRAGCTNCKRRKVKCSETRPACQACVLRKDTCVYPKPPPNVTPPTTSLRGSSSPGTPQSKALALSPSHSNRGDRSPSVVNIDPAEIITKEPLFRPPGMNDMTEMKLLWFYTTETFSSFSVETRRSRLIDDALRVKVVEHAFQSPFLMQCLLGLSALQLRSLGQPMTAKKAAEYSSKAFEGYRSAIQNAEPGDYPALLAASLLMCALSTEMFREQEKKRLCVIDWMTVWRGIGLIVDLITPKSIHESGLAVLFYRPPIDLEKTFRFIPNNLLFMVSSITPDDADYPHQQVYYDALKYLGSLYMELQHGFSPILDLRVITFFTFIPRLFLPLAREERPRALIILAHYLIFTKLNTNVWWMQGLADREIEEICHIVGDERSHLTAVPRKVQLATDKVEIARIIIDNHNWNPTEQDFVNRLNRDPRTATLALINDEGKKVRIEGNAWVLTTDSEAVAEALKSSPDKLKPCFPSHERLSDGLVTELPAQTPPSPTPQFLQETASASSLVDNSLPIEVVTPYNSRFADEASTPACVEGGDLSSYKPGLAAYTNSNNNSPGVGSSPEREDGILAATASSTLHAYSASPAGSAITPGSSLHSPASASYTTPSLPLSDNQNNGDIDRGTAEEKWALMGKLDGRSRDLGEFVRLANSEDDLLSKQLNI